jgi:hypothetical protein
VTASYARVATRHAYRTTSAKRVVTLRITLKTAAYARVRRAAVRRVVLALQATPAGRGDVARQRRAGASALNARRSDDWPIRLTERR